MSLAPAAPVAHPGAHAGANRQPNEEAFRKSDPNQSVKLQALLWDDLPLLPVFEYDAPASSSVPGLVHRPFVPFAVNEPDLRQPRHPTPSAL